MPAANKHATTFTTPADTEVISPTSPPAPMLATAVPSISMRQTPSAW
jgi:hypothetical protein